MVDSQNYTIREITPVGTNWVVTTIAGAVGWLRFCLMGQMTPRNLNPLTALPWMPVTICFVTDSGNYAIRKIAPIGTNWWSETIIAEVTATQTGRIYLRSLHNPAASRWMARATCL